MLNVNSLSILHLEFVREIYIATTTMQLSFDKQYKK